MDLDNLTKLCLRGSPLTPSPHPSHPLPTSLSPPPHIPLTPSPNPPKHTPTGVPPRCLRGLRSRTSGVLTGAVTEQWALVLASGWSRGLGTHSIPSQDRRGARLGGPGMWYPGNQPATGRPRFNIGSNGTEYPGLRLDTRAPGHGPATRRGERTAR